MTPPLLDLRDISMRFGAKQAVDGISLTMPDGAATLLTLAGESGCGKSTLAQIALGFQKPDSGTVLWRGAAIYDRSGLPAGFRREVQAVIQNPFDSFNPFYRVDRILRLTARRFPQAGDVDEEKRILAALEAVHLDPRRILGRYPHQLSGGQLQRLSIARAILPTPRLLVADEPVSMVDASLRLTILRHLQDLKRHLGISILYITHDLSTARAISDEILILRTGQVVERGRPDDVLLRPQHAYTQELIAAVPRIGRNPDARLSAT